MMKTSHPPIRRMTYIDQQIRAGRFPNCNQVAREFEVDPKTIHRDIAFMREQLDVPIAFDPRKNGYYYTKADYFLPSVHFDQSELMSFLVTEKILKQYQNTPHYEHVKKALEKLTSFFPEEIPQKELSEYFDFQTAPSSVIEQEKYTRIEKAVMEQFQIRIVYHSLHSDETKERLVDPYYILNKSGSWYFIGFCHSRKEIRIFALNRVVQVELTENYFSIPENFTKEAYLGDSFQLVREGQVCSVKLRFTPFQARWIKERQWHKSQQLTDLPDGSLLLELKVNGLSDVKRWVLQYGAEVEVLEPEVLRTEIKNEIEKMGARYQ